MVARWNFLCTVQHRKLSALQIDLMALRLTYRCSQKNEKMGLTKVGVS